MHQRGMLLILDADDTLWESGVFFERTEFDFLSIMESLGFDRDPIRRRVHKEDIERLAITGYGARPYFDTLRSILIDLVPIPPPWALQALSDLEMLLLGHPVVLLPGVLETLEKLDQQSITTVVYTMGEIGHQTDKFERSGLSELVDDFRIVPRKTPESLSEYISDLGFSPNECLLAGNSPRSDINPALAIGVRAIHIARSRTWAAEREDFVDPGQVITIERFDELYDLLPLGDLQLD